MAIPAIDTSGMSNFIAALNSDTAQRLYHSELSSNSSPESAKVKKHRPQVKLLMNTSTEQEWMALRGIGPVLSKRIVQFRSLLGGFIAKEQLMEVYGLKPEVYQQIEKHLVVDTVTISTLSLSGTEFKQLLRHPYLEYEQVAEIFNMRRSKNGLVEIQDLYNFDTMDSLDVKRLLPYVEP